jgi:hypothetical protein
MTDMSVGCIYSAVELTVFELQMSSPNNVTYENKTATPKTPIDYVIGDPASHQAL